MAKSNPIAPVLTAQDIQRFWSKVNKAPGQGPNGDCWEWTAGRDAKEYGQFCVRTNGKERNCRASRLGYFLATGEWPLLNALHRCDNPPCCRGDHLFEGSDKDNMADAVAKGRIASGSRQGAYTHPETVRRGIDNCRAKLTENLVREIRLLYDNGLRSQRALATLYRLHPDTIYRIVNRKTWVHVL